jgi:hypothetical protein
VTEGRGRRPQPKEIDEIKVRASGSGPGSAAHLLSGYGSIFSSLGRDDTTMITASTSWEWSPHSVFHVLVAQWILPSVLLMGNPEIPIFQLRKLRFRKSIA